MEVRTIIHSDKRSSRRRRLVAVDLFAGCGALSLGLTRAGFRVAAAVEINPKRAKTYAMNHPRTHVFECDVRTLGGDDILAAAHTERGCLDLVAGCPPCQGFSRIRRRNARAATRDKRNDLVYEFGRLVRQMRPRAIMLENVPGLERDVRFRLLLASLRGAGYKIDWAIVDLQRFGVPQRRRRLVMVGWRGGVRPRILELLPTRRRTVREAIERLPRIPAAVRGMQFYRVHRSALVRARIERVPSNGGSRKGLPPRLRLKCHQPDNGFKDVYGRLAWDAVAPTITGGCINPSKGRFLHPKQNRALTLLEAARLQGFPIWYKFDVSMGRYPVAEMIGEALPPPFAKTAARFVANGLAQAAHR